MKNRFGFIPIVLPVLVMVLIIGLINLTGPQTAQAQEADVSEEDARLSALSLTYTDAASPANTINVLSPAFMADRGSYTAMVDYDVAALTLTATGPTGYNVGYGADGKVDVTAAADNLTSPATITFPASPVDYGVTDITVTVMGTGADAGKNATYTIELTQKAPAIPDGAPRLGALTLTSDPPLGNPGSIPLMKTDGGVVTVGTGNAGINMFKASVPFRVQSVVVGYGDLAANDDVDAVTINQTNQPFGANHAQTDDPPGTNRVRLPVGMTTIELTATKLGGTAVYAIEVTRELPVLELISIVDSTTPANAYFSDAVPTDGGFEAHKNSYKVELPFEVPSIAVTATEDDWQ